MTDHIRLSLVDALSLACQHNGLSRSRAELQTVADLFEQEGTAASDALEHSAEQLSLDVEAMETIAELEVGRDCIVVFAAGGFGYLQSTASGLVLYLSPNTVPQKLSVEEFARASVSRLYRLAVLSDKLSVGDATRAPSVKAWMLRGLGANRGKLFQVIFASLLANSLAVAISLYSLQIYDRVLPNQSYETLSVLTIGVLIAILVEGSIRIVRSLVVDDIGLAIEGTVSPGLMQFILSARLSDRRTSPSNLANLTRELNSIRELFTTASTSVIADIPFVFIFVGLIYLIGGSVAYVIIAAAFCIILFGLITRPVIGRLSEDLMRGNLNGARVVNEVAYGMETVKASGAELLFIRRWREVLDFNLNRTSRFRAVSGAVGTISASIQQGAYVAVMAFACLKVFEGEFTAGTMIAMSILTTRTLAPVTQFTNAITRWEQMKAAMTGIDALLMAEQERPVGRQFVPVKRFGGSMSLKDVQFCYPGTQVAQFKCERLHIQAGERIALLGRNGSGKSALLKTLSGHFDLEAGRILYDGLEASAIDPDDRRRAVGYLGQEVRLFQGSIRENLCLGETRWSDQELVDAINFSGATDLIGDGEGGLDRAVQDGGEGLSGGQKQCIALARLFLRDPQIVLLDEPTSALDQGAEVALITRLNDWLQDRTAVIATHRMALLDSVDRVIVVQEGGIKLDGPKDKVLEILRGADRGATE